MTGSILGSRDGRPDRWGLVWETCQLKGGTQHGQGCAERAQGAPWALQKLTSLRYRAGGTQRRLPGSSGPKGGSNPSLLHCRQILDRLSYQRSKCSLTQVKFISVFLICHSYWPRIRNSRAENKAAKFVFSRKKTGLVKTALTAVLCGLLS